MLTRLSGQAFALNSDLIERAEATPDTVVTLVDGTKHVVSESVAEVAQRVKSFRASVLALATDFEADQGGVPSLRLLPSDPAGN